MPFGPFTEKELEVKKLMTKEQALEVLAAPSELKKWVPAQLIDDHRWTHLWAKTLKEGHNLFIDEKELRKLHDYIVAAMKDKGISSAIDHKTPLVVSVLEMSASPIPGFIKSREAILLDPEFINLVGSAVISENPDDIDLMLGCPKNKKIGEALMKALPEDLLDKLDLVWESSGPNGPYIPAFELWAIPKKTLEIKEPKFDVTPLSPILPATPSIILEDPRELIENSYFIEPYNGMRAMIHRKEGVVMAFDKDLEEIDVPKAIAAEILAVKDPSTFIIDGFITREGGEAVFRMIDMPWWRESQHIYQMAETRRHFLSKLPESDHLKRSKCQYFSNRKDTIDFLKGEKGPYMLIPGTAPYPNDGKAQWLFFEPSKLTKLAEAADAEIKRLVDSGKWETMTADARFKLMTKRKSVEPLYPYAQMKTTKKGYSEKEVFGLKSVDDLAKDLFKVPSKQSVETKIDGFRVQIHRDDDEVRLFTESGHEITHTLPGIVESAKQLPAKSFVLDTEATPYGKDFENLGRAAAAPAFAKGAKKAVDDSRWALHVFDILYLDGEEMHTLPYEERRQRLRGIELPIKEFPKKDGDFRVKLWENNVNWATSAEQMKKFAEQVSKVPGSEGAMFKESESKYRLNGNTPLWSKMKSSFEIDSLVVGKKKEGGSWTYVGAIGPVTPPRGANLETAPLDVKNYGAFVKYKGKTYTVLGKTFNTSIKANVGDILRVSMKNVNKIDDGVYHWFHPQVLEKREDKTTPDPVETAETIYKTERGKQKASVFLVNSRLGDESGIVCCLSPWIAVPVEGSVDLWDYVANREDAFSKLRDIHPDFTVVGTSLTRALADKLGSMRFELTDAATIQQYIEGAAPVYVELQEQTSAKVNPRMLRAFFEEIKDMPHECMKLSCGGIVPLNKLSKVKKLAQNLFLSNPDENKDWKYVVQYHVRGLSVHADFRSQVSKGQLIGWTWNTGKSLVKPMLRRTPDKFKEEAGITAKDLELTNTELSAKLNKTPEGRKLRKALSKKVETLDSKTVKQMLEELWKNDTANIIDDPNLKILTEIKHPMSSAWLNYEDEIPAGAVGATSELGGRMYIMDKGRVQYGAQKSYFHEYWLNGDRIKNKRMIVRRIATRPEWKTKKSFAWMTFFSKDKELPYTISTRAVSQKWMPPKGVSALPQNVRSQIPSDRQYWKAKNSKEIRDELVKDIKKKPLKLAAGLQFDIKRVWHKGPEVRRGLPVTRYWLLLSKGGKVLRAWDFGKDNDPLEGGGLLARPRDTKGMEKLLKKTGELLPEHPASQTKKLKNSFDTSDSGTATVVQDTDNQFHVKLDGEKLKGTYIFVKESGDMWTFGPASMTDAKKAMLMQAASCGTQCSTTGVLHLAAADMKVNQVGELLFLKGPAIKPGEVLPMDGTPSYFTKEGIEKFWPSMYRQPIVVLHGDLKGDVIGFVNKAWFDKKTGWGWVEGIIWHPKGVELVLSGKLPAFSIEVLPESVWDPEHKHEHIIGGECVGLAVVPKGACVTCTPTEAYKGTLSVEKGKVYKFGMTAEQWIGELYWARGKSTQEIADIIGKPRSTVENWMRGSGIPRRDLKEARSLRGYKEDIVRKFGGRAFITALGTGAFTKIPRDDCPQCAEAREGGDSRRNHTATLLTVGNEHLLVNAPKGISAMVGDKGLKPKYVVLEHIHDDMIGGLHELRAMKPTVIAPKEVWAWLRKNYQTLTDEKGDFEKIYDFERRVLPVDKPVKVGAFALQAVPAEPGIGYKINAGGTVVFHVSDVSDISDKLQLKGADIYIGDGANDMQKQIGWAKEAEIPQILFTQIGHVGKTHETLNDDLKELAPNAFAMKDGDEIQLSPGNPGARFSLEEAEGIATGERAVIVRAKPYQEYAKQAIYLLGGDKILGLFVEGFPVETPVEKAKEMKHGLSDESWAEKFGDAEQVWVYQPRMLKTFESSRDFRVPDISAGPYIPHVKASV